MMDTTVYDLIQQLSRYPANMKVFVAVKAQSVLPSAKHYDGTVDIDGTFQGSINAIPYNTGVMQAIRLEVEI